MILPLIFYLYFHIFNYPSLSDIQWDAGKPVNSRNIFPLWWEHDKLFIELDLLDIFNGPKLKIANGEKKPLTEFLHLAVELVIAKQRNSSDSILADKEVMFSFVWKSLW